MACPPYGPHRMPERLSRSVTRVLHAASVILKKDRGSLEGILGKAIVFEIENLFDFRGGPVLRHRVAHGLVSADECYGTESIYACWFVFRFFCLPLFPHWEEVAERLDRP